MYVLGFQVQHNFQWDGQFRDLGVLTRGSAFEIRENSGATMKSALKHVLSVDLRDEKIFPTCGTLFQLSTEFAGVGGDVGFFKNDFYIQGNYGFCDGIVVQGTLSGGILKSISNDMSIGLSDMFYLGGPLTLRGFHMRGVGPHADGNALGSDVSVLLTVIYEGEFFSDPSNCCK